jgi:hypothetical protein
MTVYRWLQYFYYLAAYLVRGEEREVSDPYEAKED